MSATTIRAQVTEPGHPLQGAELLIRFQPDDIIRFEAFVDVHLEAEGRLPARWVPIQTADAYLNGLPDLGDAA